MRSAITRIDQITDQLDHLLADADAMEAGEAVKIPAANLNEFRWPDGTPANDVFSAGLPGNAFKFLSPDGQSLYVASDMSSWLVGFKIDRPTKKLTEFCRINLGLQVAGISSIASGGVWVFATARRCNRMVVLRLSHDWYQNRTRLLVMRVIDGGGLPTSVATSSDGSRVCVLYSGESVVRIYRCLLNGRLECLGTKMVSENATGLKIDEHSGKLIIQRTVGKSSLKLESIFEKTRRPATVLA